MFFRLTVARPRQSARQYRKVDVVSLNRGVVNLDISADSLLATKKSSDFKRVKADFTEERFGAELICEHLGIEVEERST